MNVNLHGRSEIILSQFSAAEREALLRDGPAVEALSALSSHSPALTQALSARVDLARWLFLERAFETPAYVGNMNFELSAAMRSLEKIEDVQAGLRRFKIQEMARLSVRDLTGRADLSEVVETLTSMADACLQQSLDAAIRITARRFDLNPKKPGFRPVILGMGKLGGRELNYSSDVDLIYLFEPDEPRIGGQPVETVVNIMFALVTRAMSEVTEDGMVFRVDLDLRPGGKDGTQAQALETARIHYLTRGRPWERMALIKARPVAGDMSAGRKLLSDLIPFIYRRHLDYTSLEELKDLKARFARDKKIKIRRAVNGKMHKSNLKSQDVIDVKLSPGGIREIEFFVQALILTFAGRLPHLRETTTLGALKSLAEEHIITADDHTELSGAYTFLRTLEHRIQQRELTQTQLLPRNPETLEAIALSMGFTGSAPQNFKAELFSQMNKVRRRFESLLAETGEPEGRDEETAGAECAPGWIDNLLECMDDEEASLDILEKAGFRRPDAALKAFTNIREGRFLPDRLSRYERHLERLTPYMIAGAAKTTDPDRAILHLERFFTSIGPKAGFFVLLEENPKLIDLLSILFGNSDYLSEVLISHPAILDSLIDRRSALPYKSKKQMAEELDTMLGLQEDPEDRLVVIRRFKNDETLRIGLYDLLDKISLQEIEEQLTDLAEVVMERTMELVLKMHLPKDRPHAPLAVMGLGKLGGRELAYGSDLDILFILDHSDRPDVITMETAVKLAQRFISYLSVYLEAGPGYEIDSRLRPSGGGGPLVVTLDSFEKYHNTSQLWERQALLKMRGILGPQSLRDRIEQVGNEAIFIRELPDDANEAIHNLRDRMIRERAKLKPGRINPKFSPGGLIDAEFLTQYLQLKYGRIEKNEVRLPSTISALDVLARKNLGPANLIEVIHAYETIRRAASRLSLIYARSGDRASFTPEEINAVKLPGIESDSLDGLLDAMRRVRTIYCDVFGVVEAGESE